MAVTTDDLIAAKPARPKTSASGLITIGVLLSLLVLIAFPTLIDALSGGVGSPERAATTARVLDMPDRIGPYDRLAGAEIDQLRTEVLAGMAPGGKGTNVYVEFFGEDGAPSFIVQAMTGSVRASPLMFVNEQRALAAGDPDVLTGAVDHTVGDVSSRCDAAVIPEGIVSMCLYAVDGFVVVGSGVDLATSEVASLVAELVESA